ncbi:hypothetical protein V6Z12_D05G189000 [Gossypium hirsutum]
MFFFFFIVSANLVRFNINWILQNNLSATGQGGPCLFQESLMFLNPHLSLKGIFDQLQQ